MKEANNARLSEKLVAVLRLLEPLDPADRDSIMRAVRAWFEHGDNR